ncbi:hypothetical protein AMTRI_Chr10g2340 [Amborella trichopoda]
MVREGLRSGKRDSLGNPITISPRSQEAQVSNGALSVLIRGTSTSKLSEGCAAKFRKTTDVEESLTVLVTMNEQSQVLHSQESNRASGVTEDPWLEKLSGTLIAENETTSDGQASPASGSASLQQAQVAGGTNRNKLAVDDDIDTLISCLTRTITFLNGCMAPAYGDKTPICVAYWLRTANGAAEHSRMWASEMQAALDAARQEITSLCRSVKEVHAETSGTRVKEAGPQVKTTEDDSSKLQAKVKVLGSQTETARGKASRVEYKVREMDSQIQAANLKTFRADVRKAAQFQASRAEAQVNKLCLHLAEARAEAWRADAKANELRSHLKAARADLSRTRAEAKDAHRQAEAAQIEASSANAKVEEAYSQLELAQAEVLMMQSKVEKACFETAAQAEALGAKLAVMRARIEIEATRAEVLRSQAEVKEAHCQIEAAQADALSARAEVKDLQCQMEAMQAEALTMQAKVDRLMRELETTKKQTMQVSSTDHRNVIAELKGENKALRYAFESSLGKLKTSSRYKMLSLRNTTSCSETSTSSK